MSLQDTFQEYRKRWPSPCMSWVGMASVVVWGVSAFLFWPLAVVALLVLVLDVLVCSRMVREASELLSQLASERETAANSSRWK